MDWGKELREEHSRQRKHMSKILRKEGERHSVKQKVGGAGALWEVRRGPKWAQRCGQDLTHEVLAGFPAWSYGINFTPWKDGLLNELSPCVRYRQPCPFILRIIILILHACCFNLSGTHSPLERTYEFYRPRNLSQYPFSGNRFCRLQRRSQDPGPTNHSILSLWW